MTDTIRAIETHYAGCRFRSRLEARYAVALNSRGLRWEYEPEGFETPCGPYLPDFRVDLAHNQKCWLEVKPDGYEPNPADMGRWISVSRETGLMLVAACGMDDMTIVITPAHTYGHRGHPGIVRPDDIAAGKFARFEFGEEG